MWLYKGFETKEQAEDFKKSVTAGKVSWEERTPKKQQLTSRGKEYMQCVGFGLDSEKYPFAVTYRC